LVLAAALLHATWNLVAKQSGGDVRFALVSAVLVSVVWAPVGLYFIWRDVGGWSAAQWGVVLASAFIHVVYFTVLLRGYRLADLSVVYPLARGSGPLLASVGAVLLLGESLSAIGALGVLAVVSGVFLIAGGPSLWRTWRQDARHALDVEAHRRLRLGLLYGLATGACVASYTVVDGFAVKVLLVSPFLVDYLGNVLRVPMYLPLVWRDRRSLWGVALTQWKPALAVAVLGPVAYTLVLFAMTLAPLSHVAPAREVSMLFAALIGGKLLGERDLGLRLAGAACMAGGVVALALG
jgi:drug/metabolite transporter (DMT)-like permease